ncbi:MAG: hypothetical protein ACK6AD_09980 [Cyanobacteriota bacterium]|jgi:hypothetical protein
MGVGELFLESLSSGVITQPEIDWLLSRQDHLSRPEQAAVLRLGRLLDQGAIQLGCRLSGAPSLDRFASSKIPSQQPCP